MIEDAFWDELEKISSATRVLGKALRVMEMPHAARRVEGAGEYGRHKMRKALLYEPPQPKALRGKHLPGYRWVVDQVTEDPDAAVADVLRVPGYKRARDYIESHLDATLDTRTAKERARRRRILAAGTVAATLPGGAAGFMLGRALGRKQEREEMLSALKAVEDAKGT